MRRPASPPSESAHLVIDRIGVDGDGVADFEGRSAYVPLTLPGEQVQAQLWPQARHFLGEADTIVTASPDRVAPPCPHFGPCGGCGLQHWRDEPYADWKRGLLRDALQRAGLTAEIGDLARTPPAARRRIDLATRRDGPRILLGLHARRGQDIVDMQACTVLHPVLFALVAPIRALLNGLQAFRRDGSVLLNLLDTGPDLLLRTDGVLTTNDRKRLAEFAGTHALPRIAWQQIGPQAGLSEMAAQIAPAEIGFAGTAVTPPAGAFLQASPQGEAAIRDAVVAALPKLTARGHIIELFAGIGTLTFPLAQHARVTAYEGDMEAAAALHRAAAGGRIKTLQRDLARQPLMAAELKDADAVVLDPPFAGAETQIRQLVRAGVPRIIMVSCNPAALTRDAALLQQAGYALHSAKAIDQFLWSARLESVVAFSRKRVRSA